MVRSIAWVQSKMRKKKLLDEAIVLYDIRGKFDFYIKQTKDGTGLKALAKKTGKAKTAKGKGKKDESKKALKKALSSLEQSQIDALLDQITTCCRRFFFLMHAQRARQLKHNTILWEMNNTADLTKD